MAPAHPLKVELPEQEQRTVAAAAQSEVGKLQSKSHDSREAG